MAWKQIRECPAWSQFEFQVGETYVSLGQGSFGRSHRITISRAQFRDLVKEVMPELFEKEKT